MNFEKNTFVSRNLSSSPPPTVIVIFGASGDLTARKLAPAILNLSMDDLLPSHCFLIGFGRKEMSDLDFVDFLEKSLKNQ